MVNSTTISSSPNPKSSPKLPPEKVVSPQEKVVASPEKVVGPPKKVVAPSPRRIREVNSRYNQQSSSSSSSSLSCSFSSNSSSSSSISSRRSKTEEVSNAARVLSSTRRLSVSFQGEAFKLPVSKAVAKPAPVKGTPERGRVSSGVKDHVENGKIGEVYRWPGRSKAMNSSFLTKSLDFGNDKSKLFGSSNRINEKCSKEIKSKSDGIKGFEAQCIDDDANCGSILVKSGDFGVGNGKCNKGSRLKSFEVECVDDDANCGSVLVKSGDSVVSDSDTASFGSNVGGSVGKTRGGKRGIVVPARFLQDANSRVRKEVEVGVGTPKSKTNESKVKGAITPIGAKMYLPQTPVSMSKVASVSGRFVSPVKGGTRLASINKGVGSPVNSPSPRGRPSPTRTRNGMPNVPRDNATPSILSFTSDMRRVRVGESRVNDAHELRMLYNRQLQWRFINARVEAALLVQSGTAERSLYNAWVTISKLRHSNRSKRIQLQLLRQNLKLYSILKGQAPYLENWSLIDSDHCISLSEARQALQTSIANLPLVDGARADIQLLKKAISSAADVMQGMTLSVGSQLMRVEQVSSLASKLAYNTASEISLIDQGKNLLSALNALQVYECSLNTHLVQLPREASSIASPV